MQNDNSADPRARGVAHAHGLHALADICLMDMKQREQLAQEPQFSSHGQTSQESNFMQTGEESEPFPEEVLRTLCLMRTTSADLKRLLSIPAENDCAKYGKFESKVETHPPGDSQSSRQSSKAFPSQRLDRELEKMLK